MLNGKRFLLRNRGLRNYAGNALPKWVVKAFSIGFKFSVVLLRSGKPFFLLDLFPCIKMAVKLTAVMK